MTWMVVSFQLLVQTFTCTNIGTAAIIASYFAPPPYSIALAVSGTIMVYIGSAASSFGW